MKPLLAQPLSAFSIHIPVCSWGKLFYRMFYKFGEGGVLLRCTKVWSSVAVHREQRICRLSFPSPRRDVSMPPLRIKSILCTYLNIYPGKPCALRRPGVSSVSATSSPSSAFGLNIVYLRDFLMSPLQCRAATK